MRVAAHLVSAYGEHVALFIEAELLASATRCAHHKLALPFLLAARMYPDPLIPADRVSLAFDLAFRRDKQLTNRNDSLLLGAFDLDHQAWKQVAWCSNQRERRAKTGKTLLTIERRHVPRVCARGAL